MWPMNIYALLWFCNLFPLYSWIQIFLGPWDSTAKKVNEFMLERVIRDCATFHTSAWLCERRELIPWDTDERLCRLNRWLLCGLCAYPREPDDFNCAYPREPDGLFSNLKHFFLMLSYSIYWFQSWNGIYTSQLPHFVQSVTIRLSYPHV